MPWSSFRNPKIRRARRARALSSPQFLRRTISFMAVLKIRDRMLGKSSVPIGLAFPVDPHPRVRGSDALGSRRLGVQEKLQLVRGQPLEWKVQDGLTENLRASYREKRVLRLQGVLGHRFEK